MQVVILSAGMGKRLKDKTKNHTKSMIKFLDKTILEHSLDKLTKFNISRIIIVVGFCGDEVKETIGNYYNNIPIIYVDNPHYSTTNNIYSLYLAKEFLKEDTLLLESDIVFDETIIEKLLNVPYPNMAVVSKFKDWMDGTVVKINSNDEIVSLIEKSEFDFKETEQYYKTVNIYKFSEKFLKDSYVPLLEAYCKNLGNNSYYEVILKILISFNNKKIKVLKLNNEKWYEIDDLQDFDIAETIFQKDKKLKLKKLNSYYGGYWRFKELKDFSYLVNPYFPTDKMKNEIKNNIENLMCNYPSCQSIDKILAKNIWGINEEHILIGNGASELINLVCSALNGKVGIIIPTFQEYINKVKSDIVYFKSGNPDFSYSVNDLKEFAQKINNLILINPDNPSGNFIEKNDLIDLIKFYGNLNKNVILDESFVDFTSNNIENSLLKQEIIEEFKNLIIIKSISKSYGIPGLRIGILATANDYIMNYCAENISIWNINSIGEYFLQIFNKYKDEYYKSCKMVLDDREYLYNQLLKIDFLRPIQSEANYILCQITDKYSSQDLCSKLIENNILVKDCSEKTGFENKNYIRIAVKSKSDIDCLINSINNIVASNTFK